MEYDIKCRDGACEYKEKNYLEKKRDLCKDDDMICQTEIDLMKTQLD